MLSPCRLTGFFELAEGRSSYPENRKSVKARVGREGRGRKCKAVRGRVVGELSCRF